MTIHQIRRESAELIKSISETPELDADLIIGSILKKDRTYLLFHREENIQPDDIKRISEDVKKRCAGLPVAYITGTKEFYGYNFKVTPDVLIPKPDTELMIDLALNILGTKMASKPGYIPTVCDMCTGSGCAGISILRVLRDNDNIPYEELPKITLVDISLKALSTARKNIAQLTTQEESERFRTIQSNLFQLVPYTFDLIVTNPPYIPHKEAENLLKDGRGEPLLALDGDINENGDVTNDNDGLGIIRRLIPEAYEHLAPGGELVMETGEYNAQETSILFTKHGFTNVHIEKDMNGMLRDVCGTKPFS